VEVQSPTSKPSRLLLTSASDNPPPLGSSSSKIYTYIAPSQVARGFSILRTRCNFIMSEQKILHVGVETGNKNEENPCGENSQSGKSERAMLVYILGTKTLKKGELPVG